MNRLFHDVRQEWEKVLCGLAAVLLLVFLADWLWRDRVEDLRAGSGRLPEAPSILGPGAFAFLEDRAVPAPPARNPFLSPAVPVAPTRVERPPKPTPPAPAAPKAEPAPRPAPPTPKGPPVATLPAVPARRLGTADVKYVFSTTNRSGKPVALIELHDPAAPGATPQARNVGPGDQVFGLTIQSFTDASLWLIDAAGRRRSVAFGGTCRVSVNVSGP